MALEFSDAIREQVKLRMAIVGANGSGKTVGAFEVATGIVGEDAHIVVLDTQDGQAKLYADRYTFKHANLIDRTPEGYRDGIREAAQIAGPDGVVIIDSGSHLWFETLALVDRFGGWKEATPRFNDAIAAITNAQCHVIVTIRAKVKYAVTEETIDGTDRKRQKIERLGVGPQMRDGAEYEFDILAYLDSEHVADFSNRCDPLIQHGPSEITEEIVGIIRTWLAEGDAPPPPPPFDPEKDLLPGAIKGANAARAISDALGRMAPHIDWPDTITLLVRDVYGVDEPKKIPTDVRSDWLRRLSNATAKLGELAPGEFPPATDEQVVEAFTFAFPGANITITEKQDLVAPDDPEAVLDEEAAQAAAAES